MTVKRAVRAGSRAKPTATAAAEPKGPYVVVACLCEKVLQEQDGVLSAIRIVDVLYVHLQPVNELPVKIRAGTVTGATLLVQLRSGDYRGTGMLAIQVYLPDGSPMGERKEIASLEMKGGQQGANSIVVLGMPFDQEGVYWIEILFDGRSLTRLPLSVSVFPAPIATSEPERLPQEPPAQSSKH